MSVGTETGGTLATMIDRRRAALVFVIATVLVVGSLLAAWWNRRVTLLDPLPLSADEQRRAIVAFQKDGLTDYFVVGSSIRVPAATQDRYRASLARHSVLSGQPLTVLNDDSLLRAKTRFANQIESDIRRLLGHLPGVEVVVNVEVDPRRGTHETRRRFERGPPSASSMTFGGAPAAAIAAQSSEESTHTAYDNSRDDSRFEIAPHLPRKVAVVLGVPREFLAAEGNDTASLDESVSRHPPRELIDAVVRLGYPGLTEADVKVLPIMRPAVASWRGWITPDVLATTGWLMLAILVFTVASRVWWTWARVPSVLQPAQTRSDDSSKNVSSNAEEEFFRHSVGEFVRDNPDRAASVISRWLDPGHR